jgi:squalene-hopene/tetraprenyl-beta-curcumene cyclase
VAQDRSPKNDFDRVLKLQLGSILPELVSQAERNAAVELLTAKQHSDGGWSTRDMSAVEDWHFEMSDYVVELINGLPDAQQPESDPYMTALAVVLLRQAEVPVSDAAHPSGLTVVKTGATRQWSLVDALALPWEFPLHHLHRDDRGSQGF